MSGINVDHEITSFDIAFALAGFGEDDLTRFAEDLAGDMDNQDEDLLSNFISALMTARDNIRANEAEQE